MGPVSREEGESARALANSPRHAGKGRHPRQQSARAFANLLRHASEGWHPSGFRSILSPMRWGGWVYIMTNAPYGTLYIGVTADLPRRITRHRNGEGSAFCRRYGLTRLVHCEHFERIDDAIAREKAMKAWKREWKVRLIEQANPAWNDLYEHILEASF